jgi:hypothetical protein
MHQPLSTESNLLLAERVGGRALPLGRQPIVENTGEVERLVEKAIGMQVRDIPHLQVL